MRSLLLMVFIFSTTLTGFSQVDPVGSGRAIQFDGIDDYIDLGNIYDDLTLPFTVSAWVYIDPSTTTAGPILVTQDNAPLYNGFWFVAHSTAVGIEYGDGKGENLPSFRRGKSADTPYAKGHWTHFCAVVRGASDIDLYVNGFNAGGTYGGSSTSPMASMYPEDVAKIGYFLSNGITYRFKGIMDELRLYNRALSETEIRSNMCRRLKGDEAGLIGYWNFDEVSGDTLKDRSTKGYHGILKGNPTRIFSGAPVGDESVSLYTSDWTGKTLGLDTWLVSNVSGNAYGVHIYKVDYLPSQTGGLNPMDVQLPYYGVFLAGDGRDNAFDLSFTGSTACSSFQRKDNSEATWAASDIFSQIHSRTEIIRALMAADFNVDLGDDTLLCDKASLTLTVDSDPASKSFLWSTGETSQSITINTSGLYTVTVKEDCAVDRDSISISFVNTPPPFSLGEDEELCELQPRTLAAELADNGSEYMWQDGSKEKSFQLKDFGTYWLKVGNACGTVTDTITFTQKILKDFRAYNFISPDNDDYNQYFIVDDKLLGARLEVFNRWGKPVYWSANYDNTWDGGGLPSGVYFYTIQGECTEPQKGTVTISR